MSISVLMVGAEALPFSKTGGLADVLGALPAALGRLGHRVTLVTPKYRGTEVHGTPRTIHVPGIGGAIAETRVFEQQVAENVLAVLVDRPELYERDSLYGTGGDYPDNPRRFAFLCAAALEYALQSDQPFDVLHGHDWQAGLASVYLRTRYADSPKLGRMGAMFTIHNLAYQGIFPADWLAPLELGPEMLAIDAMEYWGQISLLKGGIAFSDTITTVSPTYAKEIQTEEYGFGFDGLLATRSADLHGILNGVDVERWDPRRDPFLPEPYDEQTLDRKDAARRALLERLGPRITIDRLRRPLVGVISRLVDQKGFDLVAELTDTLPAYGSFAVLGTGDPQYETMWRELADAYPDRFAVKIGFDEGLAHLIEAAADIFLMPSRFEPCGLNQMYSMRYGTVPVVRAIGGLSDTVIDYNGAAPAGTGFTFRPYTPAALQGAMDRAKAAFANPNIWKTLQRAGMRQDFSWDRSAREYVKLYDGLRKKQGLGTGD
jgi:starch synthase